MMPLRSMAAIALVTAAVACGEATTASTSSDSVTGQYTLIGFDGSGNLPCCGQTDSLGTIITTGGGLLQVGWNTPSGAYEWDVVRRFQYSNGTSQQLQSQFSVGTYMWDGQTLTLVDSTQHATMTATRAAGRLTIQAFGHQYEFLELVETPHE